MHLSPGRVTHVVVTIGSKVHFPAMDPDQWALTLLLPRIPFIISPQGLPENAIIYIITILSKCSTQGYLTAL